MSEVSTAGAQQDLRSRVAELERELSEAHQREAATADLLQVINRAEFALQSVFDAIARSAGRLCEAEFVFVLQFDGELLSSATSYGLTPEGVAAWRKEFPRPAGEDTAIGRAILRRAVVQIPDVLADAAYSTPALVRMLTHRSVMAVPFLREGHPIGGIAVGRAHPGPFPETQIRLLQSFADQAVIAIENTRLFEAEQARTRELSEALEQQIATSKVLEIISSSTGDLQHVLATLLENATRLCQANFGNLFLREESEFFRLVATHNAPPQWAAWWQRTPVVHPHPRSPLGRAVNKEIVHVVDLASEQPYIERDPTFVALVDLAGARAIVSVPMLKDGEVLGVVAIYSQELRPFTAKQIELLKTFADQAVIAIENTRLFEEVQARTHELQESLEYQTATNDILNIISRSQSKLQPVLDAIVNTATRLCQADYAFIWKLEGSLFQLAAMNGIDADFAAFAQANLPVLDRSTSAGRCVLEKRPIHIPDVFADPEYRWHGDEGQRIGNYRTLLGVPLMREDVPFGAFALLRREAKPFTDKEIELVASFADQAAIAIENTRLFEEVQARTSELAKTVEDLEIASQHKSQFVANMSHELRTPLAAILGYAELMQEGFYEPLGQKSLDALTRIRSNGKHLLGLINTVLDIAKIESGQFTLNMAEYAIESVVETVRAATESLAQNKRLTLTTSVDKSLPIGLGDEQRLTQVLLNLVGNAIKFTDAGQVSIAAGARNGHFAVSVTDTGPGIPLDQQDRIFEQFHQVDSSMTKAKGGTGLGLAIAKQIVEMHGGRIWVESTLGASASRSQAGKKAVSGKSN